MPRPTEFDYNKNEKGEPTSSHVWEEQFFAAGHKGPPPVEALKKRIEQLTVAAKTAMEANKARKGWVRELEWRKSQLSQQEDTDVRDTEHQE